MVSTDIAVVATVVGSIILFGGAAVLALSWAFRTGQFDNFQKGALSIFGPDEPVGEVTDAFPGTTARDGGKPRDELGREEHPTRPNETFP